jgi:hypothetical protein
MSASGLAIVAALVFARGALPARLERFDVEVPQEVVEALDAPARPAQRRSRSVVGAPVAGARTSA